MGFLVEVHIPCILSVLITLLLRNMQTIFLFKFNWEFATLLNITRQFSFISYFPKKFFSYIIVCRKSVWDSLLKFNSQYILHINMWMLLSQIIQFNIQKKPYGKLLFTPHSSSTHAASVTSDGYLSDHYFSTSTRYCTFEVYTRVLRPACYHTGDSSLTHGISPTILFCSCQPSGIGDKQERPAWKDIVASKHWN
jgi:hypothetical protein